MNPSGVLWGTIALAALASGGCSFVNYPTDFSADAGMAAEDVALGVRKVALKLGATWPKMKILVLAVFPRDARPDGALRRKVAAVNALLPGALKDVANVTLLDINARFLDD